MKKQIAYYEFPNGTVVKAVQNDRVYQFDPVSKSWNADPSLTAVFAWDRPYGEPCENLRQKVDLSEDLPPFPGKDKFFPGSTIQFGAYPQASLYDFSPIQWIVLEANSTTALCIAKDCLITSCYCDPHTAYGKPELWPWDKSVARDVCIHHFFDTAFSDAEKARIIPRELSSVRIGEKCTDPVFLLSEQEVMQYFPLSYQRQAKPTAYAQQKGGALIPAADGSAWTCWWLLPEEIGAGQPNGHAYAKAVLYDGSIHYHGRYFYHADFTVRPCVQINYQ